MVSDDVIKNALEQMRAAQAQRSWVQRALSPAPQLRLNALGQLELAEGGRDTHDEWRALNEAPR